MFVKYIMELRWGVNNAIFLKNIVSSLMKRASSSWYEKGQNIIIFESTLYHIGRIHTDIKSWQALEGKS